VQEELAVATPQHPCTPLRAWQEELAKQQVAVFPHPPYSPCGFFSFRSFKEKPRGRQYQSVEIVTAIREAVRDLPATIFQQYIPTLAEGTR
jgi:hypothetical protein